MANQYGSHPIRATSRAVSRKKARRIAWFVVGTVFGISCATALKPLSPSVTVAQAPAPVVTLPIFAATQLAPVIVQEPVVTSEAANHSDTKEVFLVMAAPKAEAAPVSQYPVNLDLKVNRGDTLASILTDVGASQDDAHNVLEAAKKHYDLRRLATGQNISVKLDKIVNSEEPIIKSVSISMSLSSSLQITRTNDGGFNAKKLDVPLERKLTHAGGKINSSLYLTASNIGLPSAMVGEIINAYSYDVDFQRDIKQGDTIEVLYERLQTKEGKKAGSGNLIFAELNLGKETIKIYRYVDKSGNADYYNTAGESVRKALLRTPINGARISSGFGMRNHPILGYSKMHQGVDFAASTGTPIYAAGDGTVEYVGRKGGYGNYLKLKHNNQYSSAYAHISRFASGMAPGKRVKQGQIVAYVGSTGNSTGPHLHYEILANGTQVNPSSVKFKTGTALKGKELIAFRQTMEKIEANLNAVKNGNKDIAMADFEREAYSN